jgi:Rrf2 family nitric oxide-sensitive transcriptional repressor
VRLTRFTDYTLRTLMYLAMHPDSYVTIAEIAGAFRISSNHLMKVVQHLAAEGDVVTMRGQHGGLRLARPAETISLGRVVMNAEPDMDLLPSDEAGEHCPDPIIALVKQARDVFVAALNRHTVADLIADRATLSNLLRRPTERLVSPHCL